MTPPRNAAIREFTLTTPIRASRDQVWSALVSVEDWPKWNRLVPVGHGDLRTGEVLSFQIRRLNGSFYNHRPVVLALEPPCRLALEASFGHRSLVHLVHIFAIEEGDAETCRLVQTWEASGLLVPMLWRTLQGGMERFTELGDDLARWVEGRTPHPER